MLGQLWLFWVAPLVGAALAGLVFRGFGQATGATAVPAGVETAAVAAAAAADDEETDEEDRLFAEAGEEPASDAALRAAATPSPAATPAPAERKTGEDEARDFFDKRGQ